ncbi:surface protein P12p-like [Teleopsis dalmanni]|uniref:surface protein P12p-like n=1 Tax=Teleopsis dalmanni TaxID=139649 RepID=UPI0018CF39E5|nr:surface protein P12p-like [Teleopsis dalmanni]
MEAEFIKVTCHFNQTKESFYLCNTLKYHEVLKEILHRINLNNVKGFHTYWFDSQHDKITVSNGTDFKAFKSMCESPKHLHLIPSFPNTDMSTKIDSKTENKNRIEKSNNNANGNNNINNNKNNDNLSLFASNYPK